MRTLGLLMRTNFLELVGSYNKKGKMSFILAACALVLVGLFLIGTFAIIGGSTAFILVEKDLGEYAIYTSIGLGFIVALMFGVTNSTRDAKGADTDMLLAMPIPKSHIVISKLLGMYLLDVLCALVLMIPSLIIVVTVGHASSMVFVRGILFGLLVPAIPLFISLLVSAVISYLKKATKFGQIFSTLVSIGVMVLYMFVVRNISTYADSLQLTHAEAIETMKKILPLYWITDAIYTGNFLNVVFALLITLVPLALAIWIHARSLNGIEMHIDHSDKALTFQSSSVRKAAFKMEFTRYYSSANYVMNTIFGVVFLAILTGIVAVKGVDGLSFVRNITVNSAEGSYNLMDKIHPLGWAAIWSIFINFFAMITYTTPASVSIEGKRIWISKTLPISTKALLQSKILVSLLIFQPFSIICSIVLGIATKCGIVGTLLILLITSSFQLLTSLIGMLFGLIFAKLDWKNEAQVIKSGWAITMTMLVCAILAFILATPLVAAVIFSKNIALASGCLGGTLILILGLCVGAYAIITHYGVRKYESLNG